MNQTYNPNGRLSGKSCIVTGATSGIGKGIAREFALQGARVMLSGRSRERAEAVMADLAQCGAPRQNLAFHPADLADVEECRALVNKAVEVFGVLDVLVNNAADVSRGNIETTTIEEWEHTMATNLRAPFVLTQAAIPHMKGRGGSVINIGSVNAMVGETKLHAYAVSKAGLLNQSKNAAAHLNQYNIRVNILNVGWTLTEGEDKVMKADTGNENWLDDAVKTRAFGRLLLPRDIAMAALYFASDESACVTGAALDIEQHPLGSRGTVGL